MKERRENLPTTAENEDEVLQGWSPVGLGFVSRGLQVPHAFQGSCLHFAEDVLEAIQVQKTGDIY